MKTLFLACGAFLALTGAASACVSQAASGGNAAFANGCDEPVVVKYTTPSGGQEVVGPIPPGGTQSISVPAGEGLPFDYCDYDEWTYGTCRLP